jgi:hypothetical protein
MDAANSTSEVPRVAVRPPPFWPERPAVWFAQAEAQFTLAGISSEKLKFCHVISQLDHRYATVVEDIITSPPTSEPYTVLKAELVRRLSPTTEQRICQLLTAEEIGDHRPSQFLRYLRSLAHDVSEIVLRSVWTSRLPHNVQSFLAGQNETNLDAAALCADRISEVGVQPALATISQPTEDTTLRQEVAELARQVAALTAERDRLRTSSRPKYRSPTRQGTRPALRNRRPGSRSPARDEATPPTWWYRRRFGARAQNCTPPCSFRQQEKLARQTSPAAHV